MNNFDFAQKVKEVATKYKTLYVMGCFGAPMNASNKKRYCSNHTYNKQRSRTKMIQAATADTFGFDCVCLIKGVLWGWTGNKNKTYGGATYNTNNVPDIGADAMIKKCSDISTDFSDIEVGEAVWMSGHIGVYIGDGLAVECTPKWENCVQITAVSNIGKKAGYNARKWTKHGKLPYIEYESDSDDAPYTLKKFVKDVQKAFGASVDGIAGRETLSKTITVSSRINNKHAVVAFIQKRLMALGYTEVGTADGVAGPKFTSAVAHFQQDNACAVDGEITAKNKTWKKLLGMK